MKYQGSAWGTNATHGTEWSENGNHILQAQWKTNNYIFFIVCTTDGWWGNSEALRAAERGKGVDLVRLLYIIRLYLVPIYRRRRGLEYNYMLCIIALSCFFSGARAARWWRLECKRLFCYSAKSVTEKKQRSVDCAEAGKKTVQTQRNEGEDFCLPVVVLRNCP